MAKKKKGIQQWTANPQKFWWTLIGCSVVIVILSAILATQYRSLLPTTEPLVTTSLPDTSLELLLPANIDKDSIYNTKVDYGHVSDGLADYTIPKTARAAALKDKTCASFSDESFYTPITLSEKHVCVIAFTSQNQDPVMVLIGRGYGDQGMDLPALGTALILLKSDYAVVISNPLNIDAYPPVFKTDEYTGTKEQKEQAEEYVDNYIQSNGDSTTDLLIKIAESIS